MSGAPDGYAVVPVERGVSTTEVARALLAAADDPRDVIWLAGQSAFQVPDPVAERYRASLAGDSPTPIKTNRPRRTKRSDSNG